MDFVIWLNNNIVWGIPMLVLMLGTGIFLLIRIKGVIFTRFGTVMTNTLKTIFEKQWNTQPGTITPFQAVCTALAATVGTGNIVGIAVAISVGGPGAIFWMWVAAILGMVTKYCETTLAVAYREKNNNGDYVGGPMYYISKGLGWKKTAYIFCIFAVFAFFIASSFELSASFLCFSANSALVVATTALESASTFSCVATIADESALCF